MPTGLWSRDGGLIRYDRDSEFTAVLGHEIGHCVVSTSPEKTKMWNDILTDLVRRHRPFSLQALSMYMFFRRSFEEDADKIGVQLMKDTGYDPDAARQIWCRRSDPQRLSELFGRSILVDALMKSIELEHPVNLDDHPSDEERCVALTKAGQVPTAD